MGPDLLLLLCDTARADAFSPWGADYATPTMERLCREGVAYRHALAQAPWTVPSTASMFTGRLPTEHGITGDCFEWVDRRPTSPAEAVRAWQGPWLPEVLRERGYRTWAASCNSWVSNWGGFGRGFEELIDIRRRAKDSRVKRLRFRARKAFGKADRGAGDAVRAFTARLARASGEPLFAFVNLMETHAPFDPPRPYYPFAHARRMKTRRAAGGPDQGLSLNAGVVDPPPGYEATLRSLYASCARYEDMVLGRFVQAVIDRGRPAVVAVVADHGEQLGEHGLFNHNSSLGQALLHVPLVVWGWHTDLGSGWVEDPVSLLRLPEWAISLAEERVSPMAPGDPVVSEYEGTAKHNGIPEPIRERIRQRSGASLPPLILNPGLSVRDGAWKYVATGNGLESLFDLADDPGEERDVAGSRADVLSGFRPMRQAWERRRGERPEYLAGAVAEGEIEEHLRELGYID